MFGFIFRFVIVEGGGGRVCACPSFCREYQTVFQSGNDVSSRFSSSFSVLGDPLVFYISVIIDVYAIVNYCGFSLYFVVVKETGYFLVFIDHTLSSFKIELQKILGHLLFLFVCKEFYYRI